MRNIRPLLGLCLLAALPSMAASQDIRDCPLDRLVFVDHWGGAEFAVSQAAGGLQYLCQNPDGGDLIVSDGPGEGCRLLGSLHLIGAVSGVAEPMVATYSVIWGSPCCGWSFTRLADAGALDFAPIRTDLMPLLGDAGIYPVMESDAYGAVDPAWPTQNPLIPTMCVSE